MGKRRRDRRYVRNSETSASESPMKRRKENRVTSKPGLILWSGKQSSGRLRTWLGGVRRVGGVTLFQALLGNVGTGRADAEGEVQVGHTARTSVPMRRTGAEQPVVARKRGNARGAKGLRHSVSVVGQPARGGTDG